MCFAARRPIGRRPLRWPGLSREYISSARQRNDWIALFGHSVDVTSQGVCAEDDHFPLTLIPIGRSHVLSQSRRDDAPLYSLELSITALVCRFYADLMARLKMEHIQEVAMNDDRDKNLSLRTAAALSLLILLAIMTFYALLKLRPTDVLPLAGRVCCIYEVAQNLHQLAASPLLLPFS